MSETTYRASIAAAMAIGPERFDTSGTTVCPADDRRESNVVSHYRIGLHSVLWCDPALGARVGRFDGADHGMTLADFDGWATADGAELLGSGFDHALPDDWSEPPRPPAAERLDTTDPSAVERIRALLDACTADERDDADFDVDALDPFLVGWRDRDRVLALAGGRPWPPRPGHHDIGVIVHPEARGRGLGAAVVAALTSDIVDAGETPLYRCNQDNVGSWSLCRSVGYRSVAELTAHRWP